MTYIPGGWGWKSGWISPDLRSGTFSSSHVLTGHQELCQAEIGRLIWIPMLLRGGLPDPGQGGPTRFNSGFLGEGRTSPTIMSFLPSLTPRTLLCWVIGKSTFYSSRINASVQGENGQLKKKKQKILKAWDVYCFLIPQLDFIRILQKSEVWGLCCPIVRV